MIDADTRTIGFGAQVDALLASLVTEHNATYPEARHTDATVLAAVYRRGARTYDASHRPGMSRSDWAMARVSAFMHLLSRGKPTNIAYVADNDLLPPSHPRHQYSSLTAAATATSELTTLLPNTNTFEQPEDAVLALTEYMGMGYTAEPAIRASWMRALQNGEDPYVRAKMLATMTYDSLDADLLPEPMEGDTL